MLLEELKDYLQITWSDEKTDNNLTSIINRGQAYLNRKAGTVLDYDNDEYNQLLLDYCRYVYNHTFELFEINFKRELLSLALQEGMRSRAEKNTETTS